MPTAPFAPGSVSLRLYPHNDLAAPEIVAELRAQAALGAEHGFDGVMTAEHHGGFAGYLPNPLQVAGWCLEAMGSGWAAPCPLLLPLRPPAMVAEEIAWLAARFPGRVGLGVAAGALPADFEVMGLTMDDLARRFADALEAVTAMLSGRDAGALAGDPAIAACVEQPVPVMSAAMGFTAVRRAARLGAGILFDSLSAPDRCRELIDAYREAGGTQSAILIRRAWVGEPPREQVDAQVDVYRSYSSNAAMQHWKGDQYVGENEPGAVVETLIDVLERTGADALNLRVHVPGVTSRQAREQIIRLGSEVLPGMRKVLTPSKERPGARGAESRRQRDHDRASASTGPRASGTCRSRRAPTRRRPPRREGRARRGGSSPRATRASTPRSCGCPRTSRRRCTATTTRRCSWSSKATAPSTASPWAAST